MIPQGSSKARNDGPIQANRQMRQHREQGQHAGIENEGRRHDALGAPPVRGLAPEVVPDRRAHAVDQENRGSMAGLKPAA